ncbi:MAG TPA: HRDC domain-containing protein, partial [Verrucomicrobiae bacterium]|nr:HRDC domain-containing protein [Verrucomicrobiae bacterium]
AYLSAAWAESDLQICYLTEQHRQQGDDELLAFLEAMRGGELEEVHQETLQKRFHQKPGPDTVITRLYSHNIDVEAINQRHLAALPGESKHFEMRTKGGKAKIEQLSKGLLTPEVLELKVGAEVMFVANNFAEGFVNGSRGQVIAFEDDGTPIVQLLNGRNIYVEPHSWSLSEDGKVRAEISQLPLRLAWAITIHKSQGMSLDAAEIDLSRAFTPGMGYVALSRVRGLDGLYLQGINAMALTMHPQIHELDRQFRQLSSRLSVDTPDIAEEIITPKNKDNVHVDQELLAKLKAWRLQRAQADSIPAYIIAHNTTLEAAAAAAPTTPQQLLSLPGFGSRKVESYGPDILAIITTHTTS